MKHKTENNGTLVLPKHYTQKVQKILKAKGIFLSDSLIRQVKGKHKENEHVIRAFVELSNEYKELMKAFQSES